MKRILLDQICEIQIGKTPSRSVPKYWGGDLPWATISDFAAGRTLFGTKEMITKVGAQESGSKLIPKGTLLLSFKLSLGKRAFAGCDLYTNEAIAALEIRDSRATDPGYLYWALGAVDYDRLVDRAAKGKTLNKAKLKMLEIPLPSIDEQKRIAKILDAADELRAKRRRALADLDAFIRSVFVDMFGDPLSNPKGFQPRALSDFYINEEEGTRCGPFGSALKKHELVEGGIPVWNMDNIDRDGRSVLPFRMWVTPKKYRHLQAYAVKDGDVLISRAGTVGKMCVANTGAVESIISTNLIRVRFGEGLLPIFFVSLMTYCKGRVGRLKTGPDGSFTHMNTGVLDKLTFPYPPVQLQKRFAVIVESVAEQKQTHHSHLSELDALLASLQSQAFQGGTLSR